MQEKIIICYEKLINDLNTLEEVKTLGLKVASPLPKDFLYFLMNTPKGFLWVNTFSKEVAIHKLNDYTEILSVLYNLSADEWFLEKKTLPFAETLGGGSLCISLEEADYGQIFLLHHSWGIVYDWVAPSFTELLAKIKYDENDIITIPPIKYKI